MSNEEYWSIHEMGEAFFRKYMILEQARYNPYSDIQDINRRIRTLTCLGTLIFLIQKSSTRNVDTIYILRR